MINMFLISKIIPGYYSMVVITSRFIMKRFITSVRWNVRERCGFYRDKIQFSELEMSETVLVH